MSDQTQSLALLSGLFPDWGKAYSANGISIRKTNANDSDKSVADTVALMGIHARKASQSIQIKQALQGAGCANQCSEDETIRCVFSYIKNRVSFIEDEKQLEQMFEEPRSKELLITPEVLLGMPDPRGDCDDFSMLACAMLMAKGIQCDFVTVAANSGNPKDYSHIYCMVTTRDGRKIPFDSSHGDRAGWETGKAYRKQVWPVFGTGGGRDGREGGLGMVVNGSRGAFDRSFEHGLRGLMGMGDDSDLPILDNTTEYGIENAGVSDVYTAPTPIATTPSSTSIFTNLLPNLFGAVEKIAVQTTQQPGVSQQVCNSAGVCTTSTTVLPANYAGSLNIPGLSTSSISSLLPFLLIGGLLLFAMEK